MACTYSNILNMDPEKCKMIKLRALFFADEDRHRITCLIVKTLRLSLASGNGRTPKEIWEQINALMIDAVTKNLEVEKGVGITTYSIAYDILCRVDEGSKKVVKKTRNRRRLKFIIKDHEASSTFSEEPSRQEEQEKTNSRNMEHFLWLLRLRYRSHSMWPTTFGRETSHY